jgi:hypothetical protein
MATPSRVESVKPQKADKPRRPDLDRDESLDRTIESTFPASDPPSSIPDPEPKLPRNDGPRDGREDS